MSRPNLPHAFQIRTTTLELWPACLISCVSHERKVSVYKAPHSNDKRGPLSKGLTALPGCIILIGGSVYASEAKGRKCRHQRYSRNDVLGTLSSPPVEHIPTRILNGSAIDTHSESLDSDFVFTHKVFFLEPLREGLGRTAGSLTERGGQKQECEASRLQRTKFLLALQ